MGTWAYELCQARAKQEEETLGVPRYSLWGLLLSGDTAGLGPSSVLRGRGRPGAALDQHQDAVSPACLMTPEQQQCPPLLLLAGSFELLHSLSDLKAGLSDLKAGLSKEVLGSVGEPWEQRFIMWEANRSPVSWYRNLLCMVQKLGRDDPHDCGTQCWQE